MRMYHFRNRDYSPSLGRWNRQDPLGYVDGVNLFQYVASRPASATDALGLLAEANTFSLSRQSPTSQPSELEGLIAQLGNADPSIREDATNRLLELLTGNEDLLPYIDQLLIGSNDLETQRRLARLRNNAYPIASVSPSTVYVPKNSPRGERVTVSLRRQLTAGESITWRTDNPGVAVVRRNPGRNGPPNRVNDVELGQEEVILLDVFSGSEAEECDTAKIEVRFIGRRGRQLKTAQVVIVIE